MDDEKETTPESERSSPKSSPCRSSKDRSDNNEGNNEVFEKRSSSIDGSLSEGTPPSDPWRLFSDFRGKLTRTLEDKLSEIKSEKANKASKRSRENSSVSDPEDLGDVTPTEDFVPEKQEGEFQPTGVCRRRTHRRFGAFSTIRTGLKAKNSEEDSVESGVEAAESVDEAPIPSLAKKNEDRTDSSSEARLPVKLANSNSDSPERMFAKLKRQLLYQVGIIPIVLWLSYYILPLPEYLVGLFGGVFIVLTIQKAIGHVTKILTAPMPRETVDDGPAVSIVEIAAVEEHAVVERFEDWLNELPYDYDPENYHVARTNPVFFKLEGETLRIMETRTRIPKRAVWNEPQHVPKFTRKRVYSLASAKIQLLPDGLTRRRY